MTFIQLSLWDYRKLRAEPPTSCNLPGRTGLRILDAGAFSSRGDEVFKSCRTDWIAGSPAKINK